MLTVYVSIWARIGCPGWNRCGIHMMVSVCTAYTASFPSTTDNRAEPKFSSRNKRRTCDNGDNVAVCETPSVERDFKKALYRLYLSTTVQTFKLTLPCRWLFESNIHTEHRNGNPGRCLDHNLHAATNRTLLEPCMTTQNNKWPHVTPYTGWTIGGHWGQWQKVGLNKASLRYQVLQSYCETPW